MGLENVYEGKGRKNSVRAPGGNQQSREVHCCNVTVAPSGDFGYWVNPYTPIGTYECSRIWTTEDPPQEVWQLENNCENGGMIPQSIQDNCGPGGDWPAEAAGNCVCPCASPAGEEGGGYGYGPAPKADPWQQSESPIRHQKGGKIKGGKKLNTNRSRRTPDGYCTGQCVTVGGHTGCDCWNSPNTNQCYCNGAPGCEADYQWLNHQCEYHETGCMDPNACNYCWSCTNNDQSDCNFPNVCGYCDGDETSTNMSCCGCIDLLGINYDNTAPCACLDWMHEVWGCPLCEYHDVDPPPRVPHSAVAHAMPFAPTPGDNVVATDWECTHDYSIGGWPMGGGTSENTGECICRCSNGVRSAHMCYAWPDEPEYNCPVETNSGVNCDQFLNTYPNFTCANLEEGAEFVGGQWYGPFDCTGCLGCEHSHYFNNNNGDDWAVCWRLDNTQQFNQWAPMVEGSYWILEEMSYQGNCVNSSDCQDVCSAWCPSQYIGSNIHRREGGSVSENPFDRKFKFGGKSGVRKVRKYQSGGKKKRNMLRVRGSKIKRGRY